MDSKAQLPDRSWSGRARIGMVDRGAFNKLLVSEGRLELKTLASSYEFLPDQVVAIEPIGVVPIIGKGIRIHHNLPRYPQQIFFYTTDNPKGDSRSASGVWIRHRSRRRLREEFILDRTPVFDRMR